MSDEDSPDEGESSSWSFAPVPGFQSTNQLGSFSLGASDWYQPPRGGTPFSFDSTPPPNDSPSTADFVDSLGVDLPQTDSTGSFSFGFANSPSSVTASPGNDPTKGIDIFEIPEMPTKKHVATANGYATLSDRFERRFLDPVRALLSPSPTHTPPPSTIPPVSCFPYTLMEEEAKNVTDVTNMLNFGVDLEIIAGTKNTSIEELKAFIVLKDLPVPPAYASLFSPSSPSPTATNADIDTVPEFDRSFFEDLIRQIFSEESHFLRTILREIIQSIENVVESPSSPSIIHFLTLLFTSALSPSETELQKPNILRIVQEEFTHHLFTLISKLGEFESMRSLLRANVTQNWFRIDFDLVEMVENDIVQLIASWPTLEDEEEEDKVPVFQILGKGAVKGRVGVRNESESETIEVLMSSSSESEEERERESERDVTSEIEIVRDVPVVVLEEEEQEEGEGEGEGEEEEGTSHRVIRVINPMYSIRSHWRPPGAKEEEEEKEEEETEKEEEREISNLPIIAMADRFFEAKRVSFRDVPENLSRSTYDQPLPIPEESPETSPAVAPEEVSESTTAPEETKSFEFIAPAPSSASSTTEAGTTTTDPPQATELLSVRSAHLHNRREYDWESLASRNHVGIQRNQNRRRKINRMTITSRHRPFHKRRRRRRILLLTF